jgi:hypothetical protein
MTREETTYKVSKAWRTAASHLSIRIEAPYRLPTTDGLSTVLSVAYLPDFGGANGMVVGLASGPAFKVDRTLKASAKAVGVNCSFINPDVYEHYGTVTFKEAIIYWGYFGTLEDKPGWIDGSE